MGRAPVPVEMVHEQTLARLLAWRRQAHRGLAVLHGDAVRSGKRPEVVVEGAVFLHDDDDVPDLMNPLRVDGALSKRGRHPQSQDDHQSKCGCDVRVDTLNRGDESV